ncbi:MAG TPA: hypothetical protein PKV66_05855, partial [Candidatus Pelethenecus sp.]|nr:hypothetical protein [Candidatus Pelethenecus sp.]
NNYIENANSSSNTRAGIVVHSGVNEAGTTTTMNLQWIPFNILIQNNTIVDSRQSILFCGKYTYPAKDVQLDGNLIVTAEWAAIRFDKVPENLSLTENHIFATAYLDTTGVVKEIDVPAGANFSTEIPTLTPNAAGIKLHDTMGAKNLVVLTSGNAGANWLE